MNKKKLTLKNYKPPKNVGPNLNDPVVRGLLHWKLLGGVSVKNNKNN